MVHNKIFKKCLVAHRVIDEIFIFITLDLIMSLFQKKNYEF